MMVPTYASEPQIQYLHQLLEQLHNGQLLIPDFQRPPRWKDSQRKGLLDSVTKSLPVGSLMVWRTTQPIKHKTTIGRQTPKPAPPHTERQYLLDGFQRMSTFYNALYQTKSAAPEDSPDADGNLWRLGYDLEEEEWVFLHNVSPHQLPVVLPGSLLLNSVALIRFQRRLKSDEHIDRSDLLSRRFREYKLPVVPLVTNDIDIATETFGLLNTEGSVMNDLDLLTALTWTQQYSLRDHLDRCHERLNRAGWGELKEKYLLATIKAVLGQDLYETDAKMVGTALRKKPAVLDEAIDAILLTISFLEQRCGVVSIHLLPYSYQLVLLAELFHKLPHPSQSKLENLRQWFWATTMWGTFSGISGYQMRKMRIYLQGILSGETVVWPQRLTRLEPLPLPRTANAKNARSRSLAMLFFEHQSRPPALMRRLKEHAARALVRGIQEAPRSARQSLGNMFLVSEADEELWLSQLQDAAAPHRSASVGPATRERHMISEAAWSLLRSGDPEGFIRQRHADLEARERAWLAQLGPPPGVAPPAAVL